MKIKNLFVKDIARPINGVVKAEQLDEASVWQELDEDAWALDSYDLSCTSDTWFLFDAMPNRV